MLDGGYELLTKLCEETPDGGLNLKTFIFRLWVFKESKGTERGKQCQQFTQALFSCLGEAELD